jgi:arsenite methyltransferase
MRMETIRIQEAINVRYSALAEESCCLSCGGAASYGEPKAGEICLDLGSGRGTDVLRMAEAVGPAGHAYGVDVSDGMVEKARQTAGRLGAANVTFLKGELDHLPLPAEGVDLVVSNCTINHAADKPAAWREIYRVLKPGGRFVVSDIYATAPVPALYASDPQAIAECWAGSVTREEYFHHLAQAGFTDVSILSESTPYAKGSIEVVSFTITASKAKRCCCSSGTKK